MVMAKARVETEIVGRKQAGENNGGVAGWRSNCGSTVAATARLFREMVCVQKISPQGLGVEAVREP
jgi:hypothetical protein